MNFYGNSMHPQHKCHTTVHVRNKMWTPSRMTHPTARPNRKEKARLLHPLLLPVCRPIR